MSNDNADFLYCMRHSAEHVLMQAVERLYPKVIKAMGPATEEGFYFDFEYPDGTITQEDFSRIEKEMRSIIKADLPITRVEMSLSEARELFSDNAYKCEWLAEIEGREESVTVYWSGTPGDKNSFCDLCRGPHVASTGEVGAVKLLSVAGAYWRGDEKNIMLTRLYGTAFANDEELQEYLKRREEAMRRDHRTLGKAMDLFSTNQLTGAGLILWHPKLATVRMIVEDFWRKEHISRGYQMVYTPHIASMDLFTKTRHYVKYIDNMYPVMLHDYIEGEAKKDYAVDEQLKPMNCPNHVQIFKTRPRSYRELPLRMGELGAVYRYERAGVLHGLTRVRGFTQDDSHIFCTSEQAVEEVKGVVELTQYFYQVFGFEDFQPYLSTRPEKYLGTPEMWEFAEGSLRRALEEMEIDYQVDPGEGVFYGPKIDFKVKDSLGREWQLGTVQFDFNLPMSEETSEEEIDEFWRLKTFREKFGDRESLAKYLRKMGRGLDVTFTNKEGEQEQVIMIHRVVLGSLERFFGILIEHYGGAFPAWLAPVQAIILPVSQKVEDYCQSLLNDLRARGVRVELDSSSETLGKKIRNAQGEKIPYMLVAGEREREEGRVNVRLRNGEIMGTVSVEDFWAHLEGRVATKALDL